MKEVIAFCVTFVCDKIEKWGKKTSYLLRKIGKAGAPAFISVS